MLRVQKFAIGCTLILVSYQGSCGVKLSDDAKAWLNSKFTDNLAVSFSKDKIAFKGCKQKSYQLNFTQALDSGMRLQGTLMYDKGVMSHGHLSQRVSTHAIQLASWWDYEDFSFGLSAKQQSRHEISIPFSQPIDLPRSQTLGLHFLMPGILESHEWEIAAIHDKWSAEDSQLTLPWDSSYNNRVELSYSISF